MLLDGAGAENEDEFYRAYDVHQETLRLKGQLADVKVQLAANGSLDLRKGTTEEELIHQGNTTESELSSISDDLNLLINEKAELVNKTKTLTDET